ncbi:MAG: deoxyribodipyrimidine photo-lyase [Gammaproteobacteria bacterium]
MRGVIWFREDLRTSDNPALYHATQKCRDGLLAVYLIDTAFWNKHDIAACRVEFLLRGLIALQTELEALNIPLHVIQLHKNQTAEKVLLHCIESIQAEKLFFNRQYEIDECRRDQVVEQYLAAHRISCHSYHDQVILPPNAVKTQQNSYFKIFTPFKKTWLKVLETHEAALHLLPKPKPQPIITIETTSIPATIKGFTSETPSQLWPAGEIHAQQQLTQFIQTQLKHYDKNRDFPSVEGTSKLSPYLTAGMISAKQCFKSALQYQSNEGAQTWMSELIWREFYKHLLAKVPRLSMNKPYQLKTLRLPWQDDEQALQAWQQGQTGVPIIDAAMRQLNTIGWMHNRLRMIVAMFLARNLMLDWRLGEKYFMQHLIDGDLAANNGGWQWCAGTGADVAPYFRVFNPIRQSLRFDPEGQFIRHYCPELKNLDNRAIHAPWEAGFPAPMIDLGFSRSRFIAAFKALG